VAGPIKFRNAYLYWNGAFVTEGAGISLKADREMIEDTSYGDTNKTYQPGFADFAMTVKRHYDQSGFFGLESDAIANAPTARAFYMYPDRGTTADYWYGAGAYVSLDSQDGDMRGLWEESYMIRASAPVYHRTA